ncbi:hypothetical protein ILUMI_08457 [Ignelater luminosus]|uniref:Protein DP71L n=1 Tax=Ignelater luminosus TaxID=2038154 RepID=A0A8K0D5M6_IGNLU|nr:hypothetical protein ILUMI_08457 [Ignelater luminosus]
MFNMNGFGQNRPMCNNRQYGTWKNVKEPEDMKLKPEYLGNENFKFVNNFGLPQQFNPEKKFVEINNYVNYNLNQSDNRMALKPSHNICRVPHIFCAAVHTNFNHNYNNKERPESHENITKIRETNTAETMTNKQVKPVEEFNKNMPVNNQDSKNSSVVSNSSTNSKHPKKNKRNSKAPCDKGNQKSCKKSKKQKNFQKQSKKETDRNIINSMSPRKRKNNKSRNKKYSKIEVMDIDDQIIESPITCLPKTQMYIQTTICSPIKISMKINNTISSSNCNFSEPKQSDIPTDCATMRNRFRSRLPSECESEDSFIVFEEGSGNLNEDDCEDSSDSVTSSDEESDESDVMDFYTSNQNSQDSTSSDDECDSNVMDFSTIPSQNCRLKTSLPRKKVRFADEKDLCEIHPMIQWSFAYQKARKGPWEQFALDRARFKNRVSNVEPILNAILQPLHRNKMFKERFQDDD